MSESANLGLPYLEAAQAQKHVTVNEALDVIDCLAQLAVRSRAAATPPGSADEGDRYLVASGASGAWAGKDGAIVVFQAGHWVAHQPRAGWRAWIEDEAEMVVFDGEDWRSLPPPGAIETVSLLGVGTVADEDNPFAVKANKALVTALTVSEGGDGDFRYTINKEAAGDTLSLLLQSGYEGRAELGLVGGDDFTLKVSSDGSSWAEALMVDAASGHVSMPKGFSGGQAFMQQWPTSTGGVLEVDYQAGQHVEVVLGENVSALSVSNWPDSGAQIVLVVKQDATGGRSFGWPSGWLAAGGSKPVVTSAAHGLDRYLISHDGSATVIDILGQDYG